MGILKTMEVARAFGDSSIVVYYNFAEIRNTIGAFFIIKKDCSNYLWNSLYHSIHSYFVPLL